MPFPELKEITRILFCCICYTQDPTPTNSPHTQPLKSITTKKEICSNDRGLKTAALSNDFAHSSPALKSHGFLGNGNKPPLSEQDHQKLTSENRPMHQTTPIEIIIWLQNVCAEQNRKKYDEFSQNHTFSTDSSEKTGLFRTSNVTDPDNIRF